MSQPFDGKCEVPNLLESDQDHGEFWVRNPWLFSSSGENLSAYERNGVHLNAGSGNFFDMSFLTGADSDGDGRSITCSDINGDGMPELFVRQAGGGSLMVFENRFPKQNWLRVSLKGTQSNSFGIGSKVTICTSDRTIRREVNPVSNFLSQSPAWLEIGLGKSEKIESVEVLWPSRKSQTFKNCPVNRHVLVTESNDAIQLFSKGRVGKDISP